MIARAFSTPRPMPTRTAGVVAGALVLALALPVFLLAGWPARAWALAAVLWVGGQALGVLLGRLRIGADNLAASGVVAVGMMFRATAVMVVLIAVAVSDARLAVSAALVYALAYTLELAVLLASYFGRSA
jgi:hypothetical protein